MWYHIDNLKTYGTAQGDLYYMKKNIRKKIRNIRSEIMFATCIVRCPRRDI